MLLKQNPNADLGQSKERPGFKAGLFRMGSFLVSLPRTAIQPANLRLRVPSGTVCRTETWNNAVNPASAGLLFPGGENRVPERIVSDTVYHVFVRTNIRMLSLKII